MINHELNYDKSRVKGTINKILSDPSYQLKPGLLNRVDVVFFNSPVILETLRSVNS